MSDVMIAGIFTVIGGLVGVIGALIQSLISSHNNKKIVELQTKKEIQIKKYYEKEKLYSDIISFLPQLALSITSNNKIEISTEAATLLNSFKARLALYSTKEIYNGFYITVDNILSAVDSKQRGKIINDFVDKLLEDFKGDYK